MQYFSVIIKTMFVICVHIPMVVPYIIRVHYFQKDPERKSAIFVNNQVGNEDAYGIHLNEDTQRAPPWPTPRLDNETMFVLPRKLQMGDKIHVAGKTHTADSDRKSLTLSLITSINEMPDYQNIACQVDVKFQDGDIIQVQSIVNGNIRYYEQATASEELSGKTFDFEFVLSYVNGPSITIHNGSSYLGEVNLEHPVEIIKYLTVHGDSHKVEKLDFEFA